MKTPWRVCMGQGCGSYVGSMYNYCLNCGFKVTEAQKATMKFELSVSNRYFKIWAVPLAIMLILTLALVVTLFSLLYYSGSSVPKIINYFLIFGMLADFFWMLGGIVFMNFRVYREVKSYWNGRTSQ